MLFGLATVLLLSLLPETWEGVRLLLPAGCRSAALVAAAEAAAAEAVGVLPSRKGMLAAPVGGTMEAAG